MIPAVAQPAANVLRSLVWRRVDDESFEYFQLWEAPGGYDLVGRVIAAESGRPLTVDYRLRCCNGWRSRELELTQSFDGAIRHLQMALIDGHWWVGARDRTDLSACVDIDLAITPATNALPINRLGLQVGDSADVPAAWVQFPSLEVAPAPQRYARRAERRWRFTSLDTDFTTAIEVDQDGLAADYEGIWTRIADLKRP